MRKILNGKLYNTETAEEVGFYENNLSSGDFRVLSESLFKKKTGEFFLYGEGGPLTKYAKSFENGSYSYGRGIIPLTEDEAKNWAEQHISVEEYEEIFGEVSE